MEYVSSDISKEVGRLVDWTGPLRSRRYTSIPCSAEPEIQLSRLRYMLSQGPKESLVFSPLDWPGVHSAWALMNGQPLPGLWIDRTGMYEARRRGDKVKKADYTERLELRLSPLPCWSDLDPLEYRRRVAEMVKAIEDETWERHHLLGTKPMGPDKILAQSPYATPTTTKTSKAPRFHTATPEVWIAMLTS